MDDAEPTDPQAALIHYRQLVASLTRQVSEAENDIRDYTESSKELQDELEKELGRMEKSEKDLMRDLEKEKDEAETWKGKYTTALREHTATITHMQRELESLRTSEKGLRTKLRDMELDNDDLEKSEREKDTTLQDLETRYGRSIERIALLEEELVTKAQLEEEVQRLKDEMRDLGEEMSVLKSSATTYPPAYPRPLTPPGSAIPQQLPRNLSATPPPTSELDSFATPTKASPTISLVDATPAPPRRTSSPVPLSPSLSVPTVIRAPLSSGVAPLARSTKTRDLVGTASSSSSISSTTTTTATPRIVRQQRAEGMIKDMKEMTDRVKQLTSRLDSRRNLVMAGSAIPRASMSPASAAGLGKSTVGAKRTSALGQSQLGAGGAASGLTARLQREREKDREAVAAAAESRGSSDGGTVRPASRSAMRMSFGGGSMGRTSIPVRPPSRLSTLSASTATSSGIPTPTSSRPVTPSYSRSSTPSTSRPGWNGVPSLPTTSNGIATSSLAASRRRTSSSYTGSGPPSALLPSTNLNSSIRPRDSTELRRPNSAIGAGAGLGVSSSRFPSTFGPAREGIGGGGSVPNGSGKEKDSTSIARRASLALGRSGLRKPSFGGAGGGGK